MWELTPGQLFISGGAMMWPLLLCSVITLAIFVDKVLFFRSIREDHAGLQQRIFGAIRKNDIKEAVRLCELSDTPLARVLSSGLAQYGRSRQEIEAAMEASGGPEVYFLDRRLPELAVLGRVAPLLGFLGTVIGLCSLLHIMSARAQVMNPLTPENVAAGLWASLIATAAGLAVGAFCVLGYGFLAGLRNAYIVSMEKSAAELAFFLDQTCIFSSGKDQQGQYGSS